MAYGKSFKGRCTKCGKYGHESTNAKCPENNEKKKKKKKKKNMKNI